MRVVRRTLTAQQDCRDIWRYIAADNTDAADRLLEQIDTKIEMYLQHPMMGANRKDVGAGLRSFPVGNYLVFYRVVQDGIEVIRVLHGARNLKKSFE